MSGTPEQKPRIIIDEDWKSQVEEEKERLKEQTRAEPSGARGTDRAAEAAVDQLPPASLSLLVTSLATQALVWLGQLPDPLEQQHVIQLDLARHQIDTLAMLEEKTRGNTSAEEARLLDDVLHQLRMAYVAVQQQVQASQ